MNKLNLSFIMSSYGDDLRCKDLHSTGVVKAQTLTVKKGGNFNAGGAYLLAAPVDGTTNPGFTPGEVGDIVFVFSATATVIGVWVCHVAGGATVRWARLGAP
tara:strand:+ start:3286 stop:3591 length:306 start_codon:yes stop_codon:yes gene_type:complete